MSGVAPEWLNAKKKRKKSCNINASLRVDYLSIRTCSLVVVLVVVF